MILLCVPLEPWSVFVPAISPLATAALVLATWTLPAFAVPGLVIALLVCWRHRWFCHWVCPTGCCADGATWLGRRFGRRLRHVPVIGQTLALIVLAGACLGYPVLLWMDPLALLSGAVGTLHGRLAFAPSWGSLGLVLVLVVSLLWPHAWCARLCPLGGLQDVLTSAPNAWSESYGAVRRAHGRRLESGILLPCLVARSWEARSAWRGPHI